MAVIPTLALLAFVTQCIAEATDVDAACPVDEWDNIRTPEDHARVCVDSGPECAVFTLNCWVSHVAERCACTCNLPICSHPGGGGSGAAPTPSTSPPVVVAECPSNYPGTDKNCNTLAMLRNGWYCKTHPIVMDECKRSCCMYCNSPPLSAQDWCAAATGSSVTVDCSQFDSKKLCKREGKHLGCVYRRNSKTCVEAKCDTLSGSEKHCKNTDFCAFASAGELFENDTCFYVNNPPEHDCSVITTKKKCKRRKTAGLCNYSKKGGACRNRKLGN